MFNIYGNEKQDHRSNIHSKITTPPRKYDPIIPNELVQEHHMKNIPFSSASSSIENRKGHNPSSFIKSHVKYKDVIPSYQYISPMIY